MLTLVPAYGRDYKSQAAVKADWDADKDFVVCDMSSKYDGKPINRADALRAGIREVKIRYKALRQLVVVRVG